MEQDQEVRGLEQVKEQGEEAAARAEEVVLRQARAVIAFAPTVVKEQPINWGAPVMSNSVLSAELP